MGQLDLMNTNSVDESALKKGKGPPNRMNDLPYREWMKFQKSFFRHQSDQLLLTECVHFFTKAVWPDGASSRTLILGFDDFDATAIISPRQVQHIANQQSDSAMCTTLETIAKQQDIFDFIMLDLRPLVTNETQLSKFLSCCADRLFATMRRLLRPDRYCGVVVPTPGEGGGGFPLAWAVAQSSRPHLRLRDEKVGLMEKSAQLFYCLFMQSKDDERITKPISPDSFRIATSAKPVPGWVIPRPPPRRKNEILHPAKYPETLVEEFIELFTKRNQTVLDPMVGTGSTVVAAIRRHRNGVGVDLSPQFVDIASKRVAEESAETKGLFGDEREHIKGLVVQGDSTKLGSIPALRGHQFEYAVTSPPYWSMLSNPGSENQEARRKKNLPLVYSQNAADLGNIADYDQFLKLLDDVYNSVAEKLHPNGILTVVVKNVKRNHVLYPLAWDLAATLCASDGQYDYIGTTFWCQDDVGLKPFAVGIHWVSNILHHYCLHFRKRAKNPIRHTGH